MFYFQTSFWFQNSLTDEIQHFEIGSLNTFGQYLGRYSNKNLASISLSVVGISVGSVSSIISSEISTVVCTVSVWPVESVAVAGVSVGQPRVSLGISISSGLRLGISRSLAIVAPVVVDGGDDALANDRLDNRVAGVAIAVVVETAIGKGEWDNGFLLLAISGLHNLLGDHGVGVVGKVAIRVRVASVATVCQPGVSLGISIGISGGLGLPLAVVVGEWVAVVAIVDGVVEGHNGLLLLSVNSLHLSLSCLDDWKGVVGVVGAIGKAMGVGVASVDQVRVGVSLRLSLGGCKCGERSNEKSPDHPGRMVKGVVGKAM